jgi:hypothetical protein
VDCLLVATDLAFEIWAIKGSPLCANSGELECLYRKQELGVELLDFVHVFPEEERQALSSKQRKMMRSDA